MELREAIGNRRSFRYLDPERPVEIEKVQRMLEAARIASHFGNNNAVRALVVDRKTATQEYFAIPCPRRWEASRFKRADRYHLVRAWRGDGRAAQRLRMLVACGALGYGEGRFDEWNGPWCRCSRTSLRP